MGSSGESSTRLLIPGTSAAVRSARGVTSPADVPRWACGGGDPARRAAAAVAGARAASLQAARVVRGVLSDPSSGLGWRGEGARAATAKACDVTGRLTSVAAGLGEVQAALLAFGAALDTQQPVLSQVRAQWAPAGDPSESLMLRRWQPAVLALDAADARTAATLDAVAARLGRGQGSGGGGRAASPVRGRTGVWGPSHAATGSGPLDTVASHVGTACAGAVDGLLSLAGAAAHHPDALAQLIAGVLLTEAGATGEVAGLALDATGVGAVAGIPAGVVSAATMASGVTMSVSAAARLGVHAVSDDRIMFMAPGGRAGRGRGVDIAGARYSQRTARSTFSDAGNFAGRTIDNVAAALREGRLSPESVPVDVICRDGRWLILNTRSSLALEGAGIPRSWWRVVDRTGQPEFERRLSFRLRSNRLGISGVESVRVRGNIP
jgi:hypothetical protein